VSVLLDSLVGVLKEAAASINCDIVILAAARGVAIDNFKGAKIPESVNRFEYPQYPSLNSTGGFWEIFALCQATVNRVFWKNNWPIKFLIQPLQIL
jgi:hypothetical protein